MHKSVLLKESIAILNPQPGEFFIDGTIGSGGHSEAILEKIGPSGKLLGIDWDRKAIENCKLGIGNFSNVILVNGNYANLTEILKEKKLPKADGLIIDLGFSSEQIENSNKGFSFMKDEPLIMLYYTRTDTDKTQTNTDVQYESVSSQYKSAFMTAAEIVNSFNEKDLADIFWKYGEERFSRQIAKKIVEERKKGRILTTFELVEIIKKAVPKFYERGRLHPATRVFQALRICVNRELENLETLLKKIPEIMKSKGRAAIISFHSLEDRLVKNYFKQMAKEGYAEILTRKPITPTEEEIKNNPRSRSAKMRAIQIK